MPRWRVVGLLRAYITTTICGGPGCVPGAKLAPIARASTAVFRAVARPDFSFQFLGDSTDRTLGFGLN